MDAMAAANEDERPVDPAPAVVPLTEELYARLAGASRDADPACQNPEIARRVTNAGAFAALGRGHVLMAWGLVPVWPGRAEAWLLVNRAASQAEIDAGVRRMRELIDMRFAEGRFRRVEIGIRWSADWRHSFTAAIGVRLECRMRRFAPDGSDYGLYARVAAEGAA